jgi:hypothetical protein
VSSSSSIVERDVETYAATASALDEGDFVAGYAMRKSERDVLRESERVLREQTPERVAGGSSSCASSRSTRSAKCCASHSTLS